MRALDSIPAVHERQRISRVTAKCKQRLESAAGSLSPRAGTATASTRPPAARTAPLPEQQLLTSLERYMSDATSHPEGSAHRLHAARYVLASLIAQLPRQGPLLSLIMAEYEASIAPVLARSPPPRHSLCPVHPLQLHASRYEADLRHVAGKQRIAEDFVIGAARRKARLRKACLETARCVHTMGVDAPPSLGGGGGRTATESVDLGGGSAPDAMVLAAETEDEARPPLVPMHVPVHVPVPMHVLVHVPVPVPVHVRVHRRCNM